MHSATSKRAARTGLLAVSAVAAASALAACSSSKSAPPSPTAHFQAVSPPAVALSLATKLAHPIRVGLVVTTSSQRGEGGDYIGMSAGALVAQYRLGLAAPGKVTLDVVDDHGNGAGSDAAVKQLVSDGVVGIVYASEGAHMRKGLADAAAVGLPVLLPYAPTVPSAGTAASTAAAGAAAAGTAASGTSAVWFTGPTAAEELTAIQNALSARKLLDTYVLISGSAAPDVSGVAPSSQIVTLDAGPGLTDQVASVAKRIAADTHVDSVVVLAPAATEAEVVGDLQQQAVQLPVLLGQTALSPTYAARLLQLEAAGQASSSGSFTSVGLDASDLTTDSGEQAFLSGLRLAASDPTLLGLESTQSFGADGAASADSRSHDAVLALVKAATRASSLTPAAVATALRGLTLAAADGAAGPALDFATPTAVAADSVGQLQSSRQDPGQRAGSTQAGVGLWWFSLPAAAR